MSKYYCDHYMRDELGRNDWEAIAEYGRTKYEWLQTFLALPQCCLSPES